MGINMNKRIIAALMVPVMLFGVTGCDRKKTMTMLR